MRRSFADDGAVTKVTYQELYHRVCRLANGLKSLGVGKGDRVVIYMPMSIEGVAAPLPLPVDVAADEALVGIPAEGARPLAEALVGASIHDARGGG